MFYLSSYLVVSHVDFSSRGLARNSEYSCQIFKHAHTFWVITWHSLTPLTIAAIKSILEHARAMFLYIYFFLLKFPLRYPCEMRKFFRSLLYIWSCNDACKLNVFQYVEILAVKSKFPTAFACLF